MCFNGDEIFMFFIMLLIWVVFKIVYVVVMEGYVVEW